MNVRKLVGKTPMALVLSITVLMVFPAAVSADTTIHCHTWESDLFCYIIWNCGPPKASTDVWLIPTDGKTYVDSGEHAGWLIYDPTGESQWTAEIISQDPWGNDLLTNGIKFTATSGRGKPDPEDPYFAFHSCDESGGPVSHEIRMKAYYFDGAGDYYESDEVTAIEYSGPSPTIDSDGAWMATVYDLAVEEGERIPTLSEWGIIALTILFSVSLAWMIRKKRLGDISA